MSIIKWRDHYSVGVEQFDEEHLILVEMVNELFVMVRDKKGPKELDQPLGKLIQYTHDHFAAEEKALEKINYPQLEEHRQEHDKLKQEVAAFHERVKQGDATVVTEFYRFLRDWLVDHIVESDKQYTPYFS
jgi:hemerythrin-like metal-binding protein